MIALVKNMKVAALESVFRKPADVRPRQPIVSFTFDDVPESAVTVGARLLEDHGATATFYVSSNITRKAEDPEPYASAKQLQDIACRGHDVGCHTHNHVNLRWYSGSAALNEHRSNRAALLDLLGCDPPNFAWPFGLVGPLAKRALRPVYRTMRSTDPGINRGIVDLTHLRSHPLVRKGVERAVLAELLDRCCAEPGWLIFQGHEVRENPSSWGCRPEDLELALDLCRQRHVRLLNVRDACEELNLH